MFEILILWLQKFDIEIECVIQFVEVFGLIVVILIVIYFVLYCGVLLWFKCYIYYE